MRQKSAANRTDSVVQIVSGRGAVKVLAINSSDKSYNADDTKRLALAAMRRGTTEAQQKKAGFFTKKSLAAATDDELAKLGLQRRLTGYPGGYAESASREVLTPYTESCNAHKRPR